MARSGKDKQGKGSPGNDRPAKGNSGNDRPGKGNPGNDRPGKGNQGNDQPGNEKSGNDRPGKNRPPRDNRKGDIGFTVTFRYADSLSAEARSELLARFIDDAIESSGLAFAGGDGEQDCQGVVTVDMEDEPASEDDRDLIEDWLGHEAGVQSYEVGPLARQARA